MRRTGREDEELCQGLKIHFEVGFREMVSGSMHRVKPCRPGAQAAILAVTPSAQQQRGEFALQGTSVYWDQPFPLSHCCSNATSIFLPFFFYL